MLYDDIRPQIPDEDHELDATTHIHFAHAVAYLDSLPGWLFKTILDCMQKREARFAETGRRISFRHVVWNHCLEELDVTPTVFKGLL